MQGLRIGVVCLLMTAGLLASASVLAQEADSQNVIRIDALLEVCEEENGSLNRLRCLTYVWGYLEGSFGAAQRARWGFEALKAQGDLPEDADPEVLAEHVVMGFCLPTLPTEANVGQLAKVFVKWAKDHPERHHEGRGVGLFNAWSEAFPCPE